MSDNFQRGSKSLFLTKMRYILTVLLAVAVCCTAAFAKKDKAKGTPDIQFEEVSHDFGTIPEKGGNVTHDFYFTNTGTAPLVIVTVSASCGCTTPKFPAKPIAPGKREKVSITYAPAKRPGEFAKNAYVRTNVPGKKKITLKIKGTVTPAK